MIRPEQFSKRRKLNTGGDIGEGAGAIAGNFIPGLPPGVGSMIGAKVGRGLGTLIGGRSKPKQPSVTTGTTMGYKYGGKYKQHLRYQAGGTLPSVAQPIGLDAVKYNGPKHEQGGIPIDESGNPTDDANAIAEVEGEETRQGDYIFSDELMVPGSDMTFAQAHEVLLAEGAGKEQIEQLAQMQEQVKQQQGVGEAPPTQQSGGWGEQGFANIPMKKGGKLPKYQYGTEDFTKREGYVSPFNEYFKFYKRPEKYLNSETENQSFDQNEDFTKREGYVSPFNEYFKFYKRPEKYLNSETENQSFDQNLVDRFKFYKPNQNSNNFRFYEHPGVSQTVNSPETERRRMLRTNRRERRRPQPQSSSRPSVPNVKPEDTVMMPTTAEIYGLDGVRSNRTIEPQLFTNRVNTEAVEQASTPIENVSEQAGGGEGFDWAGTAQRFLPSVTRLASAAFAPKPKATPRMQAQTIDERNPAFAAGRNQLASGFRANPSQGAYAQYIQGVNQLTASEAQDRSSREQFNAQARSQADRFNIQNKVADNERTAQDTAARIKLINDAIQGPLDQIAADRRGKDQMRSMIAISAAQIQNPTDRAEFLNQVLSLIEGGETAERAIEQARQNYPTN